MPCTNIARSDASRYQPVIADMKAHPGTLLACPLTNTLRFDEACQPSKCSAADLALAQVLAEECARARLSVGPALGIVGQTMALAVGHGDGAIRRSVVEAVVGVGIVDD